MRFNERCLTIWCYTGEVVASLLFYVLITVLWGEREASQWVFSKRADLSLFATAAVAVAGVVFAAFVALLCTDFGSKLRLAGAASMYITAFSIAILGYILTLCALLFVRRVEDTWLLRLATFLAIYSLLNCYTMIKNVLDLVKVWQDVERARRYGRVEGA